MVDSFCWCKSGCQSAHITCSVYLIGWMNIQRQPEEGSSVSGAATLWKSKLNSEEPDQISGTKRKRTRNADEAVHNSHSSSYINLVMSWNKSRGSWDYEVHSGKNVHSVTLIPITSKRRADEWIKRTSSGIAYYGCAADFTVIDSLSEVG